MRQFTAAADRRYIYRDQRINDKKDADHEQLTAYLRIRHRKHYKKRGKPAKRELIPNRVSIDYRPAIVETNTELGHWEGDTVIGKGHDGVLLTLVERCTKFVLIVKLKSKNALALAHTAANALRRSKLPVKTITFDNGLEFACHEHIAKQLKAVTYFAHPYHSCGPPLRERGLNENTNGLIRQYIPKSCPISIVRPVDVSWIEDQLNQHKNGLLLFSEVHDQMNYGIHIYGGKDQPIDFQSINNLFHPSTIDECFQHDGCGAVGGIKTPDDSGRMT